MDQNPYESPKEVSLPPVNDQSPGGSEQMSSSLCLTCKNMREVRTARSLFLLCQLSATNDDYRRYPPQPVEQCDGYLPKDEATDNLRHALELGLTEKKK